MGCGDAKEKIENEMVKMKMERVEIQMERQKQLKLLKDIDGTEINVKKIPDYIDLESDTIMDTKRTKKIETESQQRKKSTTKLKLRKSKSLAGVNSKNGKLIPRRKKSSKI